MNDSYDCDRAQVLSRRWLLKLGAAGLVTVGVSRAAGAAPKAKGKARKIPIALQLYSIRNECAKDFDGALKQVAEMGFDGVEFAGYHQYKEDAKGLRKKLDELKLKAAATHIGAASFSAEKIKDTIAFHKALGCKYLIVPGDGRFSDPEKSKEYAKLLSDASKELKKAGLFTGHHNHEKEFEKDGDKTYWDLFAERTPKEVVLQQDVGWTTRAGLNPAELVRKHPGRTKVTHLKAKLPKVGAEGKKPFIGQDTIDWKAIITACREAGGTEWFTVEQEDYPAGMTPMECVKQSLDGLKAILAEMNA